MLCAFAVAVFPRGALSSLPSGVRDVSKAEVLETFAFGGSATDEFNIGGTAAASPSFEKVKFGLLKDCAAFKTRDDENGGGSSCTSFPQEAFGCTCGKFWCTTSISNSRWSSCSGSGVDLIVVRQKRML